jgi:hypothetical protein
MTMLRTGRRASCGLAERSGSFAALDTADRPYHATPTWRMGDISDSIGVWRLRSPIGPSAWRDAEHSPPSRYVEARPRRSRTPEWTRN